MTAGMKPVNSIVIKGRVTEGLGESRLYTGIPWVKEQFVEKLGIDPYPGTLNLDIDNPEDMEKLRQIKQRKGTEIIPLEEGACSAQSFPVLIEGRIKGALIIPQVPDYPESQIEIISAYKLRDALYLETGSTVSIEVFLDS